MARDVPARRRLILPARDSISPPSESVGPATHDTGGVLLLDEAPPAVPHDPIRRRQIAQACVFIAQESIARQLTGKQIFALIRRARLRAGSSDPDVILSTWARLLYESR